MFEFGTLIARSSKLKNTLFVSRGKKRGIEFVKDIGGRGEEKRKRDKKRSVSKVK